MKINWAFLKKPSVIVGAVILFFIILFMLNKGTGSSSSQVVNTGPTDAQVASQTQLALAQISAGLQGQAIQVDFAKSQDQNATALALATMQTTLGVDQLAAQQAIADRTIDAQVHGLDLQYQTSRDTNAFNLAFTGQQFQYGLASQTLMANQQLAMGQQQLQAFQFSQIASLAANAGHDGIAGDGPMLMSYLTHSTMGANGSTALPGSYTLNSSVGGLH
jgi:hypothetical protein